MGRLSPGVRHWQIPQGLIYQTYMNLNQAPLHIKLIVCSFPDNDLNELSDLESRLMHLGFTHGGIVRVTKKAPHFQEPLLVEVRGRLVVMSASEAQQILVEVSK